MPPDKQESIVTRLLGKPRNGDDDDDGLEAQMRMGRALKAILNREPDPVHVGRYRLGRKLGSGGMSIVYAARDEELDREVAIKLMSGSFASHPMWGQRLRREAQAMARLGHVNIAHVYEVGEHDGHPFIAMELIDGMTLRQWRNDRERSVPEIIAIYIQAARGLAAAHAAGLVHRDFKRHRVRRVLCRPCQLSIRRLAVPPRRRAGESSGVSAASPCSLATRRTIVGPHDSHSSVRSPPATR